MKKIICILLGLFLFSCSEQKEFYPLLDKEDLLNSKDDFGGKRSMNGISNETFILFQEKGFISEAQAKIISNKAKKYRLSNMLPTIVFDFESMGYLGANGIVTQQQLVDALWTSRHSGGIMVSSSLYGLDFYNPAIFKSQIFLSLAHNGKFITSDFGDILDRCQKYGGKE